MILIHVSGPSLDSTSTSSTTLPTRSPTNAASSRAFYTDAAGKYLQARTGGRHRPVPGKKTRPGYPGRLFLIASSGHQSELLDTGNVRK